MPRCDWCAGDTEIKSVRLGGAVSNRFVHTATGKADCSPPPATGVKPEKYTCVDGNVYHFKHGRLGKFIATLDDLTELFLLGEPD